MYKYNQYPRISRRYQRHRRMMMKRVIVTVACIGLGAGIFAGGRFLLQNFINNRGPVIDTVHLTETSETTDPAASETDISQASESNGREEIIVIEVPAEPLLLEAAALAAGYDYDAAIDLLKSDESLSENAEIRAAVRQYEEEQAALIPVDYHEVTHIFFHSLIMDNQKAFDGDYKTADYNQVMTTADEFIKIMEAMYEKGYVLVRLRDLAYESTDENGNPVMVAGNIMLPEGKKAFVLSQDDVNYYDYMKGDGYASRIMIGEDGKPTCEMLMEDGSVSTGDYDLVPILEKFIAEHPGFSYKGARAVLALTGYEGILGYRTAPGYADSPTYEQDCADAAKVAGALRDQGWELASHSWGHPDLGKVSYERFKTDSDKWKNEVEPLIGPTDIMIYPFGGDVGDWHPYAESNERYQYLYAQGFRYFCNVDSNQYWVQLGSRYLRQGRRNLDGYRMWKDITATDPAKRKLDDLFRAEDIFDSDRPTPVAEM